MRYMPASKAWRSAESSLFLIERIFPRAVEGRAGELPPQYEGGEISVTGCCSGWNCSETDLSSTVRMSWQNVRAVEPRTTVSAVGKRHEHCYSPSTVVGESFAAGNVHAIDELVEGFEG